MNKKDRIDLIGKYRLDLKWTSTSYFQPGRCDFLDAYFSGPALSEAIKLNDNDHIMLDFFNQYLILVSNVYVGRFSWQKVTYSTSGIIHLDKAVLTHDSELNKVPKLEDDDYLVIDTKGHELENHQFNLVYKTYVVNRDTNVYRFGG